ncbi:MAG TPA: carboxypeptidase regulatory-like domain-containing protein [Acidobacteriaceae bacterium]|jgi:hypothetical protein|nr:carboxypeptidase regulatory-like domain-containing protein [Acidobacteriaceae bacterium]
MTTLRSFVQKCLCIAALFTLAALPAAAQSSTSGAISGTVTDTSGAAVSNATVVIKDTDTGVVHTVTTNGDGSYSMPFLLSGHYEVIASAANFTKVDHKNLVLTVGQTLTINSSLPGASVTTDVVVLSEPPILDPEKIAVSQTVDEHLIENLPIRSRNWNSFVLLTPNVAQDGTTGLISFHGISGLYNQNYVDGANNNEMLFSEARGRTTGAPFVYSADSIKEFQAETSTYSVEYGQAAGGVVNAITKSGTNQVHGDIFYDLRYPNTNALDPYSKYSALHAGGNPFLLTQPTHQQQDFGGSVGGPIIKDKLFGFFTYEGFRRVGRVLYTDSNTVSTTGVGAYTASSDATPNQCPVVGTAGYTGTTGITATQCNEGIAFLQSVGDLTAGQPSRFEKENLFFPRVDWHINSTNDAFVDFNFADYDNSFGYNGAATFSNSSPTTNAPTSYHERFLVAGLTTQIGSSSVNQALFQWGRDLETAGANAAGPSVATGVLTFGMPNALPRPGEPDEHRWQGTDVFSFTHGNHSIKVGGDANIVHEVMINLFQGGGVYSYGDTTTTLNFQDWIQDAFQGQAGDTDPYAGYHYNTFVQTVDVVNPVSSGRSGADDFWMKMWDGFAEDTWKVRSNVTLNAGIRYDIQITPAPLKNNTNFAPLSTYYSSTIKNVNRFQPRIGFSWAPHPGTVVRGGYGVYSALNQGSTYYAMRVENGVVQINYNYTGCESSVGTVGSRCPTVPSSASSLQYPNVPFPVTGPALSSSVHPTGGAAPAVNGPSTPGPQSFHGLDPNFAPPYAHEFDLSFEQALPFKTSLSVGYVGTRGMRLPVFVDANLRGQTPHGQRTYDVLNSTGGVINTLTVPVYIQSDRINSTLASYNTGFSIANTWYNSLAATVRRPFANGLEVLANYTWAHATDDGQVGGANGTFYGGDTPLDPNNIKRENGPSDIDIRNRFTMSFTYQPEIFESNKIVKYALDDFIFTGTEIASSGQPIFASMSGTVYSGTGTSYGADGNIYGGAMSSSSGAPTTGRPPQIGRNSIVGPGYNDVDFSIARNVPIWNQIHMQFSLQAFNLLNHKIVTGVQGGYSQYATSSSSPTSACSTAVGTATESAVPAGGTLQGCISPSTSTGLSTFGVPSATSATLYGPRQLQFTAKLFF